MSKSMRIGILYVPNNWEYSIPKDTCCIFLVCSLDLASPTQVFHPERESNDIRRSLLLYKGQSVDAANWILRVLGATFPSNDTKDIEDNVANKRRGTMITFTAHTDA